VIGFVLDIGAAYMAGSGPCGEALALSDTAVAASKAFIPVATRGNVLAACGATKTPPCR
jgi:hypothetical protein